MSRKKSILFLCLLMVAFMASCTPAMTETPAGPQIPLVEAPEIILFYMTGANDGWGLTETQIVHSYDGGATWYDVTPSGLSSSGYLPFFALDSQSFWVMTPNPDTQKAGLLYRTYDGGHSWDAYDAPFSQGVIQFLDAQNGFALADLGVAAGSQAVAIFKTSDGGANWQIVFAHQPGITQTLPVIGQKYGMTFVNSARGWIGGSIEMQGYIYFYKTEDGGVSWSSQALSLPEGYSSAQTSANSPVFFSAAEGILPVNLFQDEATVARVFYRTTDGGLTWTYGEPVASMGLFATASFQEIILWDGGPGLYASHDSGQTWQTVTTNVDLSGILAGLQFMDAQTGWALTSPDGVQTTLYKTTDGGATWSVLIP